MEKTVYFSRANLGLVSVRLHCARQQNLAEPCCRTMGYPIFGDLERKSIKAWVFSFFLFRNPSKSTRNNLSHTYTRSPVISVLVHLPLSLGIEGNHSHPPQQQEGIRQREVRQEVNAV